ncbi:MAG TPA: CmpA/NrtA family ABC transporter substrate-binding protein [Tepidisphaeraceae bacterium]|nr:CmpA/NrtA family ABC transporter substrate-binding protein [Tepidisphaeraceae bacterium]
MSGLGGSTNQESSRKAGRSTGGAGAVRGPVRVGFVPLIDAAPLVAALELGFFADEGLAVSLERQIGWANVRDKLAYGHLDASHALLGMPLASALAAGAPGAAEWQGEPIVGVMSLSCGGNAITLSKRLIEQGANSAATLARFVQAPHRGAEGPVVLGHVFGCSMHHYLLREWLEGAGINPDLDVKLCVIPPPQMVGHLAGGSLDGFCVGEPWNTLAQREGAGVVVAPTADILPGHPEKVLAVTRRWAADNRQLLPAMIRAVLRACRWCSEPANVGALAEMLAMPRYVGVPADVVRECLTVDRTFGVGPRFAWMRPADWAMRSFAPAATFPSRTHVGWLLEQMIRWGHVAPDVDVAEVADRCTDSAAYREAADALRLTCPETEYPPMALRNGQTYVVREAVGDRR